MHITVSLLAQAGFTFLICLVLQSCYRKKATSKLPPGPKPLPIVGNLMDLPPEGVPEFQHWLKHRECYGPMSSITVMGRTLVIIHDLQTAHDLMEKKSLKTSARPKTVFMSLCGYGELLPLRQYDDTFRHHRRLLHRQLGTRATVKEYNDIQEMELRRFLLQVLNRPENLLKHVDTVLGAIILKIAYGYSIESEKADPLVDLIERHMANMSLAGVPLSWMVDIIPALKYLPDGLVGTTFKETALKWKMINHVVTEIPYSFVLQQMASGRCRSSYVSTQIQRCSNGENDESKLNYEDEHAIKWTAAMLYAAGTETTASSLRSFILAMVMFPEVQQKAHDEINRVIGPDQLPQHEDRDKLPYIEGVVKETFRWCPIAPMGFPHVSEEDIVHNDYLIPKGAYLLPATWWFCHDPAVYADPESFNPERYLEPRNEPDPKGVIFGFGRRICPGRYLADSIAFLIIAQTLASFNIRKAVDEQGKEIDANLNVSSGVISHVSDFPYKIMPRSAKLADLIRRVEVEQCWPKSDASLLETAKIFQVLAAKTNQ